MPTRITFRYLNSQKKSTDSLSVDLQVKRSCINCKLAKTRCNNERPCRRCLRTGRAATCVDSVHKKRGRKRSVNPATAVMKTRMDTRISDPNGFDFDLFGAKQPKLVQGGSVNNKRTEVKHTLTYVETLLTVCNQQLERWNNKLRQANKMTEPLTPEMNNCKNSLKAYQWIAACMLKNLQNVVNISSEKEGKEDGKIEKKESSESSKYPAEPKHDPNKIDPREVFYGTLPIGVAVFSLQPSPFHPGNKPWVNRRLAVSSIPLRHLYRKFLHQTILGFTPAELVEKLTSLKGLSSLYHIVNLHVTIRLFMEALSHRRENYSVQTKWIHKYVKVTLSLTAKIN